jgi:Flp pilus assembly protein TadD
MQDSVITAPPQKIDRILLILKYLSFFIFSALALSLFAQKIIDTDIWWHLSAGRLIAQTGSIPAVDPFSYTAGGNEWIDLHWLFQTLVYAVYHHLGSYSLSLMFICAYAATFVFSWLACRRDNPSLLTLFFLWLALMAAGSRFLARPEAFTYLMIALYSFILHKHDRGELGRWVFLLIPLQALWTNLQGLFILGPCLIFAYTAEALTSRILRKNRDRPHFSTKKKWGLSLFFEPGAFRLIFLFLAAIAASLINPYGLKGLLFPLLLFTRAGGIENIFAGSIAELQPPFSGYNLTVPLIYFGIFVIVSALALALDWRNARLSHIIIFLGMGYLGLSARRNVPVFVFAFLPLAVEHSRNVLGMWPKMLKIGTDRACPYFFGAGYVCLGIIMVLQMLQVWNNGYYISDKRAERFGFGFKEQNFPQGAFSFIKEEGLRGPFFNSLDIGGLFMWEMFPPDRVFIDPRLEVNSETTFAEYCGILSAPDTFEDIAEKYSLNAAVICHTSQDGLRLLPAISYTPGWFLIYLDPLSAVFARGSLDNADIIARRRVIIGQTPVPLTAGSENINENNPPLLKSVLNALAALSPSDAEAQNRLNLGLAFLTLGQNERAAEQLKAGLKLQPGSPEAYYNLGLAFDRMGRKETAVHCYKKAVELDGHHSLAHANLGRIYDEQGLKDEAEREYELALQWGGDKVIPLYNLGALSVEKGRHDDARKYWERALKVDPSFQPARDALQRLEREKK